MRIGVLADIHGNHTALEAVLKEARRLGVERLAVLGDLVGYYYHTMDVMRMLKEWDCVMIAGNHERILARGREDAGFMAAVGQRYGSSLKRMIDESQEEDMLRLLALPEQLSIEIDGRRLLLCHGAPWDADQYIYPDAGPDVYKRFENVDADYVFLGHTHYPYVKALSNLTIVNAGSVGQPRDYGGLASWFIFNTLNETMVNIRTPYHIKELVAECKANDSELGYLHEVQSRNRSRIFAAEQD